MVSGEPLVCVIDDDPSLNAALVNLLRSSGYHAVSHLSAETFLASAELLTASCILTDIQMPGQSGIDLRLILAGNRPDLPVILMTARTDRSLLDRAMASRPLRLLCKPFDADELLACIGDALGSAKAAHGRPDRE